MQEQITEATRSLLLIGASDAGKTHYTGQLTVRIDRMTGRVKIRGMAESYAAYEGVRNLLSQGLSAEHTSADKYEESGLPLLLDNQPVDLVWPDYGGEQIRHIVEKRQWSKAWQNRIEVSEGWILFVRLDRQRRFHDIFSRPPGEIRTSAQTPDLVQSTAATPKETEEKTDIAESGEESANVDFDWSGQAFLVELLQILLFARKIGMYHPVKAPRLTVVLSCWDELHVEGESAKPVDLLRERAPLLGSFVTANWQPEACCVIGLSSLGKPLDDKIPDEEYLNLGPEQFGYVVLPDGRHDKDLTLLIVAALGKPLY